MILQIKRPPLPPPFDHKSYDAKRDKSPDRKRAKKLATRARMRELPDNAPFVAIDSEGFSFGDTISDDAGRNYQPHKTFLWGAGDMEGDVTWLECAQSETTENRALSSIEICEWLLKLPQLFPHSIFVSFSFSYDAAQIFADLPYEKLYEIQRNIPFDASVDMRPNSRRIVFWKSYGFQFLKGKKFVLFKFDPGSSPYRETRSGNRQLRPIAKILIYDVFGFFQSSFLKACETMPGAVEPDEYDILFSGKGNRANFQPDQIEDVKPYTATELKVLARMMHKLRSSMIGKNIHVRNWYGAGSIANALLKREGVLEHFFPVETRNISDPQRWAHHAYFGGRIELLYQGYTGKRLWGYDIASAYPAVATSLPSMRGGIFRPLLSPSICDIERMSPLSILEVKTYGDAKAPFYPLPYRTPSGAILFPSSVYGYYMQAEVAAALRWRDVFKNNGWRMDIMSAWEFVPSNHEKPFDFLRSLFDYRLTLAETDITQIVVKLGINSCYGKLAQAVASGNNKPPTFANPWYAAAITAGTRARLIDAALHAPNDIVMFATDGIISKSSLPLDIPTTKTLGAWEAGELARGGIFVQSGVYAISDEVGDFHAKSRGFRPLHLGAGTVADMLLQTVPALWAQDREALEFAYKTYVTLGSAVASRARADRIGRWVDGVRKLDLRGAGAKRLTPSSAPMRKRRSKELVATAPNCSNILLCDKNGDMPLSAAFVPEWIDPEIGAEAREAEEMESIMLGRFE